MRTKLKYVKLVGDMLVKVDAPADDEEAHALLNSTSPMLTDCLCKIYDIRRMMGDSIMDALVYTWKTWDDKASSAG